MSWKETGSFLVKTQIREEVLNSKKKQLVIMIMVIKNEFPTFGKFIKYKDPKQLNYNYESNLRKWATWNIRGDLETISYEDIYRTTLRSILYYHYFAHSPMNHMRSSLIALTIMSVVRTVDLLFLYPLTFLKAIYLVVGEGGPVPLQLPLEP